MNSRLHILDTVLTKLETSTSRPSRSHGTVTKASLGKSAASLVVRLTSLPAEESDTYPWGWTATFIAQYRKKLESFLPDADAQEIIDGLNDAFYKRKLALKSIRRRLTRVILDDIAKEMRVLLNGRR